MTHDQGGHERLPGFWTSRYALGLLVISVVAAYFLLTEHRAHFFGALPYLLLLACPLMHLFMHHGHGGHRSHGGHAHRAGDQSSRTGPGNQAPAKPGEPS